MKTRCLAVVRHALVACALLSTNVAAEATDASVDGFVALKRDVEELRRDDAKRQFRHNYERLIARATEVAEATPRGERADDALYVAAQLREEMYFVSRLPSDKDAARLAFERCASRYPRSNLADDALVAASRLSSEAHARQLLERVLAMGKTADLRTVAASELKLLKDAATTAAAATSATPPVPKAVDAATAKTPAPKDVRPTSDAPSVVAVSAQTPAPRAAPVEVLPETPPAGTPSRKVIVITNEKTADESVVVLRMSGEVGVTRGEVPREAGGARRIFFDVAPAKLGQRNIQPLEINDGVVARIRAGQYDTQVVRLVVELVGDKEPTLTISRKPFEIRLTSPLEAKSFDAVLKTLPAETAPVASVASHATPDAQAVRAKFENGKPGGVSISQQLGLRVHRVVIDAGHGGNDTGAIGPTGIREKDITLQIAQRVQNRLRAEMPELEVIMTRDDDRTLALQDRTNTANAAAADLFISIHCNASPQRRVRGVETYTLNITHDRYAMRLAARENAEMGEGSISDLDYILADLAMKSNVDDSVRLGRQVQRGIVKNLHTRWTDVPDLGLKHALFYVLMGNRMPSILVETSFLSNKTEEQRLASEAYQDSIADGVVAGVRSFVEERQAFYDVRTP